jgi:hypothetical protein
MRKISRWKWQIYILWVLTPNVVCVSMVCKKGRLSNKTVPCSPPVNMDRKSHKCWTNQYASMEICCYVWVPSNAIVGASQKVLPRYAFVVLLCHWEIRLTKAIFGDDSFHFQSKYINIFSLYISRSQAVPNRTSKLWSCPHYYDWYGNCI